MRVYILLTARRRVDEYAESIFGLGQRCLRAGRRNAALLLSLGSSCSPVMWYCSEYKRVGEETSVVAGEGGGASW